MFFQYQEVVYAVCAFRIVVLSDRPGEENKRQLLPEVCFRVVRDFARSAP